MSDHSKEPGYLLDDEDFHRIMQHEHARSGEADDQIARQRIWKRLETLEQGRKPSRVWIYQLVVLAATVLLAVFAGPLLKNQNEPERLPTPKTGIEHKGFSFELHNAEGQRLANLNEAVSHDVRIQVLSDDARFVALYGETLDGKRERIHEAAPIESGKAESFPLGSLANYKRICVLNATTRDELAKMEDMLDLVWAQLTDQQCLTRL